MNLLHRLRNIWRLSKYDSLIMGNDDVMEKVIKDLTKNTPKQAVIIKRTTPTEQFLKDNPTNNE